jgi:hypothetical protein
MMSTIPMSTDVARRFCGTCGHEVRPQTSFCGTCGQTMAQRRPAQPPAGPAQPLAGAAGRAESRPWLIPAVAALVLAAIAVPVMFVAHPFGGHGSGTGPTPPPSATASGASVPPASPPSAAPASPLTAAPTASEQQAAESLASLLAQSVADRTAVDHAYDDVRSCGPDPSADARVFQNAAASRQQLISQLADLPSRSALPPQMLQELSGAWQASAAADSDYAQWALDEGDGTCVPDDAADPNFQAATGPNEQAVQDKLAFTWLWNQLADSYGLTRYDQDQL